MPVATTLPKNPVAMDAPSGRRHQVAVLAIVLIVGGVYLLTLHPGLGRGDTASLQYASAVLGLCHPPGYQTEILVGKLFCMLPVGPDPAWRMNLMSVVFGIVACLGVYGVVRRITGGVFAGVVAALTLAFSSIFWSMAIVAEVYVFYGAFLILGVYCCVRLVQGEGKVWLYLMALALGFSIGGRPSELAVLPALVPVWVLARRKVRVRPADVAVCAVLFVLPFCVSVGGYLVHYADPSASPVREDVLGEQIRTGTVGSAAEGRPRRGVGDAVVYSLGLMWADRPIQAEVVASDLWEYTRMLLGLTMRDRPPDDILERLRYKESGIGVCMGVLGVALAAWGTIAWRGHRGWVLLGWGMFLGNLCFYLYNHRMDSRTFVIPGLVGLSVLAGMGAAAGAPQRWSGRRRVWWAACLAVPLILLVVNWAKVNRNAEEDWRWVGDLHILSREPIPAGTGVVVTSWPGNAFRYCYHVLARRDDVTVLNVQDEWVIEGARYFLSRGRVVLLPVIYIRPKEEGDRLLKQSPQTLARLGLVLLYPRPSTAPAP